LKLWEFVKEKEQSKSKKRRSNIAFAKLNNCPTSPRKMRLIADLVRGEKVEKRFIF
jgi:large subunit ribosomal protein L22